MTFTGKVVLILGATGTVGSGAAWNFLDQGATVFFTTRDDKRAKYLISDINKLNPEYSKRLHGIVANFHKEEDGERAAKDIKHALGRAPIDHVVSAMEFVKTTKEGPTGTKLKDM